MTILGIDPGTRRVGYGVVKKVSGGNGAEFVTADLLPVTATTDAEALVEIKHALDALIKKLKPDIVAVEKLFFSKNQTTGIQVAEARGVILLAAAEQHCTIREFTPNEVKMACTGYGTSDKKAVAKMVKLSLKIPTLNVIDDVTDAIAIALCALQNERLRR
jgi:crossover junction endodeoxyribonuclease RuvC